MHLICPAYDILLDLIAINRIKELIDYMLHRLTNLSLVSSLSSSVGALTLSVMYGILSLTKSPLFPAGLISLLQDRK